MTSGPWTQTAVREVEPLLQRVAQRALRDPSVARDVVQATFLAVLERPEGFDPSKGNVRQFMIGILMRKVADHFRRARRETTLSDDEDERALGAHDPSQGMHAIDRRRAMYVVDQALALLPDAQRLAVLACDVEQMEREEAAEVLGVSEGNLRVLLHRGRHQLRKALEHAGMR